ncbi:MAG: hypothetical protein WCL27_17500, partial [Betaproteobacteria bacterium]
SLDNAKQKLAKVIRIFAVEKASVLQQLKDENNQVNRPDFIWHYLLQSFSTMGRSAGWQGLIGTPENYSRITFDVLEKLTPEQRKIQVHEVCRAAKIRMPDRKATFILGCFDRIQMLGGLSEAKSKLLSLPGAGKKKAYLMEFPGIGKKYARNIMMDVYHEDFHNSIAIDVRIKAISTILGLSFTSYVEHENFYLTVAESAGINGWEMDRILYNWNDQIKQQLLAF